MTSVPRTHLVGRPGGTALLLLERDGALPVVAWLGVLTPGVAAGLALDPAALLAGPTPGDAAGRGPAGCPLLPEGAHAWPGRPGLIGHRAAGEPGAWSTAFRPTSLTAGPDGAVVDAVDDQAGLALRTEVQALTGGALRVRHQLTNTGRTPYSVDALEVVVPLPDRATESLDLTGRWCRERVPQRRPVDDGLWLRESRTGVSGHDSATVLAVGPAGFGFADGEVWGVHVAWSGNTVHRLERTAPHGLAATTRTLGGGELLLPGEVELAPGESYASPWVHVAAVADGLDGLAATSHRWLRSLPAHPARPRPVTLNVWEAVWFDHDLERLTRLADLAAEVGVERFVLDDGWFGARRDDHAGLGDWVVAGDVWPAGLAPLADHVRARGMEFGLWFEPEMVNVDSDLFRAHPDWILATGGRTPPEQRFQQVLDLAVPGAFAHVLEQMTQVLTEVEVDYVKWDHNRDLLEAGGAVVAGRPGVRARTLAFYRLLDELAARFPRTEWESCASGGGRIDLGVLERTQRVWTSDQNDALARQSIQRWTGQLVAPEYLGAHVSAPVSEQTHRQLDLDFRAGTAFAGSFGIEWDLTTADEQDRAALADWVALYRQHRDLLHGGRVFRVDGPDPAVWTHGVVAPDATAALVACVQLDDAVHEPPRIRVPGLHPETVYEVTRLRPGSAPHCAVPPVVGGAVAGDLGLPGPERRPASVVWLHLGAVPAADPQGAVPASG